MTEKMWANSGDAHVLEPPDLWQERMPADMAARMPRSEKIDERTERVHIDGRSFERKIGLNPVMTEEDLEFAGPFKGRMAPGRECGSRRRAAWPAAGGV